MSLPRSALVSAVFRPFLRFSSSGETMIACRLFCSACCRVCVPCRKPWIAWSKPFSIGASILSSAALLSAADFLFGRLFRREVFGVELLPLGQITLVGDQLLVLQLLQLLVVACAAAFFFAK